MEGVLFHGVDVVAAIGRDDGAVFSNHHQNGRARGDGIHFINSNLICFSFITRESIIERKGEPRGLGDHAIELAGILI